MKKNKRILFFLILIVLIISWLLYNEFRASKEFRTYYSPDGKYQLTIEQEGNFFSPTMPGDGGTSSEVIAVLKDAKGNIIGKSSDNKNCSVLLFSIDVTWDLENMEVSYAKAKTINLKTGEVEC
ncbi:hypothetical protein [Aquimarina litoralis]|uniref:hypothetical protein n=1 Tax=Aquimarina litoralis TaxID=584605 RepID=UPI001C576851|nr:hypothetical protein [Aquimarina litoralis]MBW1294165.1 hypothetical protein [Aquimarina litoralis]